MQASANLKRSAFLHDVDDDNNQFKPILWWTAYLLNIRRQLVISVKLWNEENFLLCCRCYIDCWVSLPSRYRYRRSRYKLWFTQKAFTLILCNESSVENIPFIKHTSRWIRTIWMTSCQLINLAAQINKRKEMFVTKINLRAYGVRLVSIM